MHRSNENLYWSRFYLLALLLVSFVHKRWFCFGSRRRWCCSLLHSFVQLSITVCHLIINMYEYILCVIYSFRGRSFVSLFFRLSCSFFFLLFFRWSFVMRLLVCLGICLFIVIYCLSFSSFHRAETQRTNANARFAYFVIFHQQQPLFAHSCVDAYLYVGLNAWCECAHWRQKNTKPAI